MKTPQQESDYNAIIWAWRIIRDHGEPEHKDEYWDNLIRIVSDYPDGENCLYPYLAIAITNAMEERMKEQKEMEVANGNT